MTIANRLARRLLQLGATAALLLSAAAAQAQTVVYYHTDALGSVVAVTDASRNVIEENEYEPYGKVVNHALQDGPGYTGHVADAQTGLIYMQQRYYDDDLGEFPTVDPVSANSVGGTFNRYWYANNNPYKFTDPDGRSACPGKKETSCLKADTKVTGTATATIPEPAAKVVVQNKSDFATRKRSDEKGGYASKNADGSYSTHTQPGATTTNHGSTATVKITMPQGAIAVHSHSDANMTMATSNRGDGDSAPLQGTTPSPFVTINRDRVMVRELVNGQLQARMLDGELTPAEVMSVQKNIDREQGLINGD